MLKRDAMSDLVRHVGGNQVVAHPRAELGREQRRGTRDEAVDDDRAAVRGSRQDDAAAAGVEQRFRKAWARADVQLTASRF